MNNRKGRQELLRDTLKESAFEPFNSKVRAEALRAFERRHQVRRLRPILAFGLVAFLGLIPVLMHSPDNSKADGHSGSVATTQQREDREFLISDQQLLAYFPRDSCTLVTTDGKTILVFWNDELRRRLFHE